VNNIANSLAVDFLGSDNGGSTIMPAYVYAAESGTVTYVCNGTQNMGVVITGSIKLGYWHITPATNITLGQTFQAGQMIGPLQYGSFNEACGHATQNANTYHIHFAFPHGDLNIGGCYLSSTTGIFTCGTKTYGKQGTIPNGGGVSNPVNPPGPFDGPVVGGDSIWDGVINGFNDIVGTLSQNFPAHTAIGGDGSGVTLSSVIDDAVKIYFDMAELLEISGLFYLKPLIYAIGVILVCEIVRLLIVAYRWIITLEPIK
jgi:hypothetical protein